MGNLVCNSVMDVLVCHLLCVAEVLLSSIGPGLFDLEEVTVSSVNAIVVVVLKTLEAAEIRKDVYFLGLYFLELA